MSEESPKKKSRPPLVRKSSGEHTAVKQMRAKFESISEHTGAAVDALIDRVSRLKDQVTTPPPTVGPEAEGPLSDPYTDPDETDTDPGADRTPTDPSIPIEAVKPVCAACAAGVCSAHQPPDEEKKT
jgi:hypothetical protein